MSTGQYQGYSVDKPTSKVMAPPGGRSSNIFGAYEEEKKPVATNGAAANGAATKNGTSNGSNGTNAAATNNNTVSPTAPTAHQTTMIDGAANKSRQLAGNNVFGQNDNTVNACANRKKRTGYNPITGELYDDEPATPTNVTPTAPAPNTTPQSQTPHNDTTAAQQQKPLHTSVSVKQPPGGRSTNLW